MCTSSDSYHPERERGRERERERGRGREGGREGEGGRERESEGGCIFIITITWNVGPGKIKISIPVYKRRSTLNIFITDHTHLILHS